MAKFDYVSPRGWARIGSTHPSSFKSSLLLDSFWRSVIRPIHISKGDCINSSMNGPMIFSFRPLPSCFVLWKEPFHLSVALVQEQHQLRLSEHTEIDFRIHLDAVFSYLRLWDHGTCGIGSLALGPGSPIPRSKSVCLSSSQLYCSGSTVTFVPWTGIGVVIG